MHSSDSNNDYKPNWSTAPDWANWFAFSFLIGAYWYANEPYYEHGVWWVTSGDVEHASIDISRLLHKDKHKDFSVKRPDNA